MGEMPKMESRKLPVPKNIDNSQEDGTESEDKITRRTFLRGMGRVALAGFALTTLGCKMEKKELKEEFDNKEFQSLKEEFIKKGFSDSKVLQEFESLYGPEAFETFKSKYDLTKEEAQKRWSSSIIRKREFFLDRAENWKKVEKIAQKNGIKIDNNSDYEMLDGQVTSINGKTVPRKSSQENIDSKKTGTTTPIESVEINTNAY